MAHMDRLVLYRGDSYEIEEFSFQKTKRTCLVGQGIYLTNRQDVADTYRVKGRKRKDWFRDAHTERTTHLFNGAVANRDVAREKAFAFFCGEHGIFHRDIHEKKYKDQVNKLRVQYDQLVDEGLIKIEYRGTTAVSGDVVKKENLKPLCLISKEKNLWSVRNLTVTWHRPDIELFGHVSVFHFPTRVFNDSMFNLAAQAFDRELVGMFYDNGCGFGEPYDDRDSYIRANTWNNSLYRSRDHFKTGNWTKMRNVLEQFGYRGFEYPGGVMTGSSARHRAFCVWDDDWVNSHRVAVI